MNENNTKNTEIHRAPEFEVALWVDANGNKIQPIKLSDYDGKFKVVYGFQSWCPGCHSIGFPSLQKMVDALQENDEVVFLAIQTVFEGFDTNTYDKILEAQKQYGLKIPFGHDAGSDGKPGSNVMQQYGTGGTPWFIFIDQDNKVVFSDFHLNADKAIAFLKLLTDRGNASRK